VLRSLGPREVGLTLLPIRIVIRIMFGPSPTGIRPVDVSGGWAPEGWCVRSLLDAFVRKPTSAGDPPVKRATAKGSTVDLAAVVISVAGKEPQVLVLSGANGERDRLPSGPLAPDHRTLEAGLRSWVEQQTHLTLGYVEQLYTFGDRGRLSSGAQPAAAHDLSIAYLALVREARPAQQLGASWRSWYHYLPWEDWRRGRPPVLDTFALKLRRWVKSLDKPARGAREERIELAFGFTGGIWDDERVLERFELLYEAGLILEAEPKSEGTTRPSLPVAGVHMALDHRRIVATAISRLRGKIKYRPIIFELMADTFTLLELQATVEGLSGVRLHKQIFRRLVEGQGLVEETGTMSTETGGRPARVVRFRREVLRERPTPGLRLPGTRRVDR
jgi:hypothetical protein